MALTVNKSGGQFQNSRPIWRIEALKVGAWSLGAYRNGLFCEHPWQELTRVLEVEVVEAVGPNGIWTL